MLIKSEHWMILELLRVTEAHCIYFFGILWEAHLMTSLQRIPTANYIYQVRDKRQALYLPC